MLGKLSFALALASAVNSYQLDNEKTLAQLEASIMKKEQEDEAVKNQLLANTAMKEDETPAAADTENADATPTTDADAGAEDAGADETGGTEGGEDAGEEKTPEKTGEKKEGEGDDKPSGSINLTVSMGAAVALLMTSAF